MDFGHFIFLTFMRDFQEFTFYDEKEREKKGFPESGNKMKFKLSDDFFSASNFRKSLLKVKYVVTENLRKTSLNLCFTRKEKKSKNYL
jgi:hypothetical protein